uniref:Uncharacterized protein n=1 Tax=Schlesneria paludicola TaxID=360056 RepID=A0A7C4LK03_9PLAN
MALGMMAIFVGIVCAVVFTVVIGGMLVHLLATGALFWTINRHVHRRLNEAAAKPCGFCGGMIAAGELQCPQCGGPREAPAD